MSLPDNVAQLVARFDRNLNDYRSGQYNETQVRREFIDPFFEALGWDVNNRQGYAEAYKDVVHEDAIKVGGMTKAPDYSFRVGGARKFFLEAKKPSVNIKQDIHPAYQLRRYAWSAKLPLSILTDFEEFAVYDCRVKPAPTDQAATARILYLTYRDYPAQWEELLGTFSREAVLRGSFDKYAESNQSKKGTTEVDTAFLQEIERWRDELAKNIALRNPGLSQRELNFAVQRTIDRIIFLRICEDRGIEPYGRLMTLQNGANTYQRLGQLFQLADDRYNSGLFHFRAEKGRPDPPDDLTLNLNLDDRTLQEILKRLYYPDSPYEFSVLPADILGQIYEQFLGKVIRLTAGHRAKVEEKPEVKKAGGVYYTPTYIVHYIVRQTLTPLLEGVTPTTNNIKILDPACGSGSFLIGAYQFLLDWYLAHYIANLPKSAKGRKPPLYQAAGGEWRLTTTERKRILLEHIYGVDIDRQAVETTKLSLLLKVLEGESEQTIAQQLSFLQERALPDLSANIKCGNSLIGPDFYHTGQMSFLDEEEMYRINVFDWATEFPAGGFDAVIGNPPYVRQETLSNFKAYFQRHYKVYHGTADLYTYFIERGVSLLKPGGMFGYIVANKWLRANYGKPLRQWLKTQQLVEIVDFGDLPVFKGATTYPCILSLRRAKATETPHPTMKPSPPYPPLPKGEGGEGVPTPPTFRAAQVKSLEFTDLSEYLAPARYTINQAALDDAGWALVDERTSALLAKLRAVGIPLGQYAQGKIYRGVLTGLNEAFVIDADTRAQLIAADPTSEALIKPFLAGRDVKRYQPPTSTRYLIFIPNGWTRQQLSALPGDRREEGPAFAWLQQNYPAIAGHLAPFAAAAQKRCDKGEYWWELRPCDYYAEFERGKIMLPDISERGNFTLDEEGKYYCVNTAYIISNADKYLLGILNSALVTFFYRNLASTYRGGYLRFIYQYLAQLPIRAINVEDAGEVAQHGQVVELVEGMLALQQKRAAARTSHDQTVIERQIAVVDRQLDGLVYQLYGLTAEEVRLVEGGLAAT